MLVAEEPTFSQRLKSLRQRAGLTVYALAKKSKVSKQAISRLESGENQPSWETVRKLATALGVTVLEFDTARELPPDPSAPAVPDPDDEPPAASRRRRPKK